MRRASITGWRLAAVAVVIPSGLLALSRPASAAALATLHVKQETVAAGSTVTLLGQNYSTQASASDIEIRLDGRDGPIIATIPKQHRIQDVFVPIPVGTAPGHHMLVATQHLAGGQLVSGAPGRTNIAVVAGPSAGRGATLAAAAAGGSWTRTTPTGSGLVGGVAAALLTLVLIARRRPSWVAQEGMRRKIRSPLPSAVAT
jgi:hypothetical protein